jgi:hypothetical protein
MSDSPTDPMASSAEAEEASPADPSHFIHPPLDLSLSQFRVLTLEPGNSEDELTATISTHRLMALPRSYNHELHLSELKAIHGYLSTAISTSAEVHFEELLRWERYYTELNDLYMMALSMALDGYSDSREWLEDCRSTNDNLTQLSKMRDTLIDQLEQQKNKSRHPRESDAVQALIGRLDLIYPGRKACNPDDPFDFSVGGYWASQQNESHWAISYFCGDQTIPEDITLNNARVQVPASAARALVGYAQKTA